MTSNGSGEGLSVAEETLDAARRIEAAYRELGSPAWFGAWLRRIAADLDREHRAKAH